MASAWSNYFNKFLLAISNDKLQIPKQLLFDPFTSVEGLAGHPWLNLPSVLITLVIMAILIVGIRESARTNAVLVGIKVSVVLLVIGLGCAYIQPSNWTSIPYAERLAAGRVRHARFCPKTPARGKCQRRAVGRAG